MQPGSKTSVLVAFESQAFFSFERNPFWQCLVQEGYWMEIAKTIRFGRRECSIRRTVQEAQRIRCRSSNPRAIRPTGPMLCRDIILSCCRRYGQQTHENDGGYVDSYIDYRPTKRRSDETVARFDRWFIHCCATYNPR